MKLLGPRNLLLVLALAFVVLTFRDDPTNSLGRARTVVAGAGSVFERVTDTSTALVRSLLD